VTVPITTACIDNEGTLEFKIRGEEVKFGTWDVIDSIPSTLLNVSDQKPTNGNMIIGFKPKKTGTFYYKISQEPIVGNYICDSTYYIVEAVVSPERKAEITNIWVNGDMENASTDCVSFTNRKTTTLTIVNKITESEADSEKHTFRFTAEVMLDGTPFKLPTPAGEANYTVENNTITVYLQEGTVTIPVIPYRAEVVVKELDHDGYVSYCKVQNRDSQSGCADSISIVFEKDSETVEFSNFAGMALPETGGIGTYWFTLGGAFLLLIAVYFGFGQYRNVKKRI
jgi:LPXTG-motif cell wall-anchored protein